MVQGMLYCAITSAALRSYAPSDAQAACKQQRVLNTQVTNCSDFHKTVPSAWLVKKQPQLLL